MPTRTTRTALALALLLAPSSIRVARAAETFDSLARRIPGDATALVLIDVEQTLASPLAQKQEWSRKLEAAYVERPVFLPPEAKKLVLGAALDPENDFLGRWELGVMELLEPPGIRAIARGESGYVDEINGTSAAVTPRDAAFVDLGANVLAVVRPADRQFLSRWIKSANGTAPAQLSEYLQSRLAGVNDNVQVLLAIDLTDVLGPRDVEERLAATAWPGAKPADTAPIAKILGSLRGATLRLAFGEDCRGQLQIDFAEDVSPLGDSAKAFVLQAFTNLGIATTEFESWKTSLAEKSIRMSGPLSTNAQRRVFSVIELPAANLDPNAPEASVTLATEPTESEVRDRSLAYFKTTQELTEDIRDGLKETKATSAYMERYARRIDELPVLHVDELLLDYGDKLAETFRIMALSKRQAGIRASSRTGSYYGGYYDGYDYGMDAYGRAADRSQAKKEEMSVANDTRVQGWQLIDDATADIRHTLTKKYNAEF